MVCDGREGSWERIRASLDAARRLLPYSDGDGVADYSDYAQRNQLGLALDVLVEIGASQRASKQSWHEAQRADTKWR